MNSYWYQQNSSIHGIELTLSSIILCHPISPQVRCGNSTLANHTKHLSLFDS